MSTLSPEMAKAISDYGPALIDPSHVVTMKSRLVHDLGVSGDDFDDFGIALVQAYGKRFIIPGEYVPQEISHDSFMVTSARGWLARRCPRLRERYRSKIKCPELTLENLEMMIVSWRPDRETLGDRT